MLTAIREFFERHLAAPADRPPSAHGIELATAALLAEVARIDGDIGSDERELAIAAIRGKLGLSESEASTLLDLAEREARQATDYFQFTSLINRQFTPEQKIRVIELMWRVAYADGRIDDHEIHLIGKIADLLHVTHPDYIAAKMRAQHAHRQ